MTKYEAAVTWLRQVIDDDLARWSSPYMCGAREELDFRVADCQAKLELIGGQAEGPGLATYAIHERHAWPVALIVAADEALSALATAYRHRPGYADHWPVSVRLP